MDGTGERAAGGVPGASACPGAPSSIASTARDARTRTATWSSTRSRARETRPTPRLGVSVGRKVGGAVERNRVKRLLRDAFWATADTLPDGHDFVVVARPESGELASREGEPGVERTLRELLEKAGFARSEEAV